MWKMPSFFLGIQKVLISDNISVVSYENAQVNFAEKPHMKLSLNKQKHEYLIQIPN